ncbi:MAG TPA: DUF5723 family protein [Segetibacter sp.]
MKTLFLFFSSMFVVCVCCSQDFPGYRAGNYTGVNSVFFNPANIADSRYRFDFNLFSVSSNIGNDQASFSLKNIGNSFNTDSISNKIFGQNADKSSGFVSTDFYGPSIMFNTGKKMAFAITTRARVMGNIKDIDGKLVDKISKDISNDPSLPYTISTGNNMRFNANAWTEIGISAARVISDKGKHFFKAGASFKYLAGAGNAFINIGNLSGTIYEDRLKQDTYLGNTTGQVATGFGGIRISDFEPEELTRMASTGFGADIGFVYEYRPNHENYKRADGSGWQRNMNKYKWKVAFALLDIGSIKYEKDLQRSGGYNIDITGNERLYLSELDNVDIDDYKNFFNSRPQFFTPDNTNTESSYKVSLPTTLQLNVDYNLHSNLYINLASQFSLVNSTNKPYNSSYYSTFTLTPRYEGRALGLYIPLSYNPLTNLNAGASVRFGPLFVGSGSVLTALFGNSKQADVHVGLRFGGLQKNMEKKEMREDRKEMKRLEKETKKAEREQEKAANKSASN